jgi:hypothetical protein
MPSLPEPAPTEGTPERAPERTLAELVAQGRTFTATECLIMLAELAHGEQDRVTAGERPGRLAPEAVVVLGPSAPHARPGPTLDSGTTVPGLVAVGWFALTGVRFATATAPRRGATIVATAGPTLGPILVDALGGALSLDDMVARLDAARAEVTTAARPGPLTRGAARHRSSGPGDQESTHLPFRVVAAASVVLAVVAGLLVWWGNRGTENTGPASASPTTAVAATLEPALVVGSAQPLATSPAAPASPVGPPAPPTATTTGSGTSSSAPKDPVALLRADPATVLQGVIGARTAAVVALDPAALARAEVPDSPAWTADRALITQVVAAGARYEGLSLTVTSASVRSVSADSAVLDAVVDRSAYVVVGPSGRQEAGAKAGGMLQYGLRWSGSAWRLVEVVDPLEPTG